MLYAGLTQNAYMKMRTFLCLGLTQTSYVAKCCGACKCITVRVVSLIDFLVCGACELMFLCVWVCVPCYRNRNSPLEGFKLNPDADVVTKSRTAVFTVDFPHADIYLVAMFEKVPF